MLGGGRSGGRGSRGGESGGWAVTALGEGCAGWGGAAGLGTWVSRYCARFTPSHPVHVGIPPGCEVTQHITVGKKGNPVLVNGTTVGASQRILRKKWSLRMFSF